MKQREGGVERVRRRPAAERGRAVGQVQVGRVGQHHALGRAGRSRRVEDARDGIAVERRQPRGGGIREHVLEPMQLHARAAARPRHGRSTAAAPAARARATAARTRRRRTACCSPIGRARARAAALCRRCARGPRSHPAGQSQTTPRETRGRCPSSPRPGRRGRFPTPAARPRRRGCARPACRGRRRRSGSAPSPGRGRPRRRAPARCRGCGSDPRRSRDRSPALTAPRAPRAHASETRTRARGGRLALAPVPVVRPRVPSSRGTQTNEGSMATEGMRLEPRDEYPHEPDELSNFNESVYVNGFDPGAAVGWLAAPRQPRQRGLRRAVGLPVPARRTGRVSVRAAEDLPQRGVRGRRPALRGRRTVSEPADQLRRRAAAARRSLAAARSGQAVSDRAPRPRAASTGRSPRSRRPMGASRPPRRGWRGCSTATSSPAATSTSTSRSRARCASATSAGSSMRSVGATTPGARASGRRSGPIGCSSAASVATEG